MTEEQMLRYKKMSDTDRDRFDLQRKIIKQGSKFGRLGGLGKGNSLKECTCEHKQNGELPQIINQLVENGDQTEQQVNNQTGNQIWS